MRMSAYLGGATTDKGTRQEIYRLHAQFCQALADPNRLLLLVELRHDPRTVGELSGAIGKSQSLTSRHLGVLRQKGIVVTERDGSFVRYSLADRRILGAIDTLLDVLATQLARQGAPLSAARRIRPTGATRPSRPARAATMRRTSGVVSKRSKRTGATRGRTRTAEEAKR